MADYLVPLAAFAAGIGLSYFFNAQDRPKPTVSKEEEKIPEEPLINQIRNQHKDKANDATLFEDLIFDSSKNKFNVLLYFRREDHDFVHQELRKRGFSKEIMSLGSKGLLLLEITSFDLIKELPVLYQDFPTTLSMNRGT